MADQPYALPSASMTSSTLSLLGLGGTCSEVCFGPTSHPGTPWKVYRICMEEYPDHSWPIRADRESHWRDAEETPREGERLGFRILLQ